MSTATSDPTPSTAHHDLTARARIRDAALHLFGQRGFKATTIRAIADEVGVSPALVVHHFGSKQGLRDAIDQALADQIREGELTMLTGSLAFTREQYGAMAAEYADVLPYLVRALSEGDELGRRLFDRLHADAVAYMRAGVEAGVVRPSDQPEARAAALLSFSLGMLYLQEHIQRVLEVDDEMEAMLAITPPILDLYTNGLFTDDRVLRSWKDGR